MRDLCASLPSPGPAASPPCRWALSRAAACDEEWHETHRRCCEFVERWGMQAHAAGWDTLHLFGVGPDTGTLRGDFCGHLIPLTSDVTEVTDEWIRIGRGRAYKAHPNKIPGMIPVWEAKR